MISNAEESDKGTYQCRAENREDSSDVSATLDVHGIFYIIKPYVSLITISDAVCCIIYIRNFNSFL